MTRAVVLAPWMVIAAVVLGLALGGDAVQSALRYQRQAVLAGELWRLLTGHWVHLGFLHAVLNLLGLALIQSLVDGFGRPWRSLGILAGCQMGVALALLVFSPQVAWYVGLSGALHGHIIALAWAGRGLTISMAVLVSLAVAAKVGWEMLVGAAPMLEALLGGRVVVVSHFHGAVMGLALGLLARSVRRRSPGQYFLKS